MVKQLYANKDVKKKKKERKVGGLAMKDEVELWNLPHLR